MNKKEESTLIIEQNKVKDTPTLNLNKEETTYYGNLLIRLRQAKIMRDREHDEFDGMTYLEYIEANKKGANTYIEPKKNKEDTNFVSGTIRQKMLAYLAALINMDLSPDVESFDEDDMEIKQLGEAMENIIFKVGEIDKDQEKKILRQYELLEQGFVFVEELWEERWRKKKNYKGKMNGIFNKKDNKWTTIIKKVMSKCTRNIIIPENVYLGDITQFEMEKQPYIFTVELRSWEEAKSIYGKWDNWKYVPKYIQREATAEDSEDLYSSIKLFNDHLKEEVEIVKYQDKWNDEYMVLINGIMMLPGGFPLSAMSPIGEYTIDKQILEPISPFFAYGKSVPSRMKTSTALLDEMYRMAILKTQKSFAPPMANNTGKVLSSRIFSPGKITSGIDVERLQKIDPEGRGVDASEYKMLEMLQRNNDVNTTDPQFSGQQPQGSPTATQILETQRQAKMMLGLTIFSMSMLEQKIAWSRINNILANWFERVDSKIDPETNQFIEKYRGVNVPKMIEGEGTGRQMVKLTEKLPSSQEVMDEEDNLSRPGEPVRITYLNPKEIKKAKYKWYVTVTAKERKTDALNKVVFDEMMQKAMMFPNINMGHLGEKFAEVWEINPAKLFNQEAPPQPQGGGGGGDSKKNQTPGVPKIPTAQNAAGGINKAAK